jgi:hypothetical protein
MPRPNQSDRISIRAWLSDRAIPLPKVCRDVLLFPTSRRVGRGSTPTANPRLTRLRAFCLGKDQSRRGYPCLKTMAQLAQPGFYRRRIPFCLTTQRHSGLGAYCAADRRVLRGTRWPYPEPYKRRQELSLRPLYVRHPKGWYGSVFALQFGVGIAPKLAVFVEQLTVGGSNLFGCSARGVVHLARPSDVLGSHIHASADRCSCMHCVPLERGTHRKCTLLVKSPDRNPCLIIRTRLALRRCKQIDKSVSAYQSCAYGFP